MRYEPGAEGRSGRYVLSTGRWFYAVSPRLSLLGDVIGDGYDGLLDDESVHRVEDDEGGDFTPAERREIAAHVTDEWNQWAPPSTLPADLPDADRQAILLSLALCSLQRPGWCVYLRTIADRFGPNGVELFTAFRECNQ